MNYDLADTETGQRYALIWAKRSEISLVRALARKLGSEKMVELEEDRPVFRLYEAKVPQAAKDRVEHEFKRFMTPEAMEAATKERADRDARMADTKRVIDLASKAAEDREVYFVPKRLQTEFDADRRKFRITTEFDRERKVYVGVKGPEGKMDRWSTDEIKKEHAEELAISSTLDAKQLAKKSLFGQAISRARSVQDGLSLAAEFPDGLRLPPEGRSDFDDAKRARAIDLVGKINLEQDLQAVARANKEQIKIANVALVRKAAEALGESVEKVAGDIETVIHMHKTGKPLPIEAEVEEINDLRRGSDLVWTRLRELGYGARRSPEAEKSELQNSTSQALKDLKAAGQNQDSIGVPLSASGAARLDAGERVPAVEAAMKEKGPRRGRNAQAAVQEQEMDQGMGR